MIMREILFRGKRTDNNEWLIGDLVVNQEGTLYIIPSRIIEQDGHHLEIFDDYAYLVNNNTIGQYTGLTDKNGVKVFEGDICKHHSSAYKNNLVSTWVENQSCYSFIDRCDFDQHYYLQDIDMKHVEVIGNIHDNPELIK